MKRDWIRISLFAQLVLAIYFQIVQWIPLGRWNYQPQFSPLALQALRGQLEAGDLAFVLAFAFPAAIFFIGYRKRSGWLMWLCLAGYVAWLVLQIMTWWVAYLFGASDAWAEVYQRVFSHSTQILPAFGRHLPPDAMHLILDLLLFLVVFSLSAGLLQHRTVSSTVEPKTAGTTSHPAA